MSNYCLSHLDDLMKYSINKNKARPKFHFLMRPGLIYVKTFICLTIYDLKIIRVYNCLFSQSNY